MGVNSYLREDSMISGKLIVRYTTFYSAGRKFRDQKTRAICAEDRQPSQRRLHCCVEPRALRDVEAFSFGKVSVWKKEKVQEGRARTFLKEVTCHSPRGYLIRTSRLENYRVRPFGKFLPSQHPCLNICGSAVKRKSSSVVPLSRPKIPRR